MTAAIPRLRMFAGPNGSGKSTLKNVLPTELLGVYINADDLERQMRHDGLFNLREFHIDPDPGLQVSIQCFFRESNLLQSAGLSSVSESVTATSDVIDFSNAEINSYVASVFADFLRRRLLHQQVSFTMETVMSSTDKVDLLREARKLGYRTYLYFVATDDPAINISRVQNRVKRGGHPVPKDKIVGRYFRCLDLLLPAIHYANRAHIFDNSYDGRESTWVAEITDGKHIEMKSHRIPDWFRRAVLALISSGAIARGRFD